jgi:hypothetical protein
MAFLSPLFLAGALAAAVPILVHLLRREPEARVKFAAVQMLQHAPVEQADRRRLRQLVLLALRVAALLLLSLAFARPYFTSGAAATATGVTMIALDTSVSLSAPGRFARAQQLAREAIDRAPSGHLVGVVAFADAAQVVAAPSGDRALAVSAVDRAQPGFGATRYRAALSTAAAAIGARGGSIVVVTDLQASGWDSGDRVELPAAIHVAVADAGEPPANLAVIAARRAADRLVATVRNAGGEARDISLHVMVDGAPAGEASGSVGAGQTTDITLPAARGNAAQIAVEDPDGIQADNVRYLVLAAPARPSVLVVTNAGELARDAFYVQQALAAEGPDGASFEPVGASGAELSGWDAAALERHAAVILLSTRGIDQRGRELLAAYVTHGGGVLLAVGVDVDPDVASGSLGGAVQIVAQPPGAGPASGGRTLAPADVRHPVFRAFGADAATLGLVKFPRIVALRGTACQSLARFSTGEAALVECPQGDGRVLVLASDLDSRWNDFPLHATFVPFLHEAMGYLAAGRGRTSSYVVGSVPAGVPDVPGFGTLPAGRDGAGRLVAVNVDARESDPARLTPDEFQAAVTPLQEAAAQDERLEVRTQEERQNLWRYAILLMAAALAAESLVAARTA